MNRSLPTYVGSLFLLALTGCSLSTTATPSSLNSQGAALQGVVHGGQQPIAGASVYLLAANTGHYSTATQYGSQSLLTAAANTTQDGSGNYFVTTAANGSFSITGDYTCTAGQQVYVLVLGGYSDGNPAHANTMTGLMAALGDCPGSGNFASSIPFIWVNEVTTVAAAYSVAGFAANAGHIGAPSALTSTNPQALAGIRNAFAFPAYLVDISTGTARSAIPNNFQSTVPQTAINTLANILAACVNTSSGVSLQCSILSGATGGSTDTASAAIYLAHNPTANVAILFSLQAGVAAPFSPNLITQPNDFSLLISHNIVTAFTLSSLDIDSRGNVWLAIGNPFLNIGVTGPTSAYQSIVLNMNSIAGSSPGSFILQPASVVAFTPNSNVLWVGTCHSGAICSDGASVFSLAANPFSPTPTTGVAATSISGLAVSGTGDIWYSGFPSIYRIGNPTPLVVPSPAFGQIAIDASGRAMILDVLPSVDTALVSDTNGTLNAYTGGILQSPQGIALDHSGNPWVADGGTGVIKFDSTFATHTTYSASPLSIQNSIAVDAGGNVWTTGANGLVELNNSGSILTGTTGLQTGSVTSPKYPAIDPSGNVWFVQSGGTKVYELIGAATPTVTPIAANLAAPYNAPASQP